MNTASYNMPSNFGYRGSNLKRAAWERRKFKRKQQKRSRRANRRKKK